MIKNWTERYKNIPPDCSEKERIRMATRAATVSKEHNHLFMAPDEENSNTASTYGIKNLVIKYSESKSLVIEENHKKS